MKSSDVLLRSAFLPDILEPTKIISLVSQKESRDIIETADYIKRGKETYLRWYKKFTANPEKVFELPNMKPVLDKLDEENQTFQGVRITYVARETGHPRSFKIFFHVLTKDSESWIDHQTMSLLKQKRVILYFTYAES